MATKLSNTLKASLHYKAYADVNTSVVYTETKTQELFYFTFEPRAINEFIEAIKLVIEIIHSQDILIDCDIAHSALAQRIINLLLTSDPYKLVNDFSPIIKSILILSLLSNK